MIEFPSLATPSPKIKRRTTRAFSPDANPSSSPISKQSKKEGWRKALFVDVTPTKRMSTSTGAENTNVSKTTPKPKTPQANETLFSPKRSLSWPEGLDGRAYYSDSDLNENTPNSKRRPKSLRFTFWNYLKSEITGSYQLEMDEGVESMAKREEVYNFIQVPLHLEKLLLFGLLLCFDSFLFLFTFLPIRMVISVVRFFCRLFSKVTLSGTQVWDLLRGLIVILVFYMLTFIDSSRLYHYIRGQAVLKLYVIFNVLEVLDKLCCSFGQDIFDALFWKTVDISQQMKNQFTHLHPLTFFLLALCYTAIHSVVLFLLAVTMNVAINSDSNSLLTLLISNQFVELKGSVFKKFEKENLFQIACADMVERFQILIFLLFVTLQNFADMNWVVSEYWVSHMIQAVLTVWTSECIVDWIKHAFIAKFNHIPPDVYPAFTKRLTEDIVSLNNKRSFSDTHTISRRIGFIPLPLACLVLRVSTHLLPTLLPDARVAVLVCLATFLLLCTLKILIRIQLVARALKQQIRSTFEPKRDNKNLPNRFTMFNGKIPG